MEASWHEAAKQGALDRVAELVREGCDVDRLDRYGQTALMLAAVHGHAEIVEHLIAHGARLDVTAKHRLSALMLAVVNQRVAIARALLEAGADPSLEGSGAPGFAGKTAGALARERELSALADELVLATIQRAFAHRAPPATMTDSLQLSDVEYAEVMSFEGQTWSQIRFDAVERNSDAVFWFSPEAFAYFLPGFLSAGLRENRCDANAYDALIGMLDRSTEVEHWDDFFSPRFGLLTLPELRAFSAWVDWFETLQPDAFFPNTFDRARETLLLLELHQQEESR